MPFIEFVNDETSNPNNSCGQVAIANHIFNLPRSIKLKMLPTLPTILQQFPPDILFGWCGTSPWRICEAIKQYKGVEPEFQYGLYDFKHAIDIQKFPIVMLSWWEGWLPVGHWAVALEYDDIWDGVNLANYGWIKWKDFDSLWTGPLNWWVDMKKGFIS